MDSASIISKSKKNYAVGSWFSISLLAISSHLLLCTRIKKQRSNFKRTGNNIYKNKELCNMIMVTC